MEYNASNLVRGHIVERTTTVDSLMSVAKNEFKQAIMVIDIGKCMLKWIVLPQYKYFQ